MRPRKLSQLLTRRLLIGSTLALIALNLVIGFVSHRQLHDHMDAMLLELAIMEAKLSSAEHGDIHIHSSPMYLPGWPETILRKGVVYDERCDIIASSWPLARAHTRMPSHWCERERIDTHHVGFIEIGGEELRAASTTLILPGEMQRSFLVGVDHQVIDGAILRLIALSFLPSMMLLVILWLLCRRIIQRFTQDLEQLSATCESIEPEALSKLSEDVLEQKLSLSNEAPQELQILAATLRALVLRLQRSLQTHSRFIAEAAHELRSPLTAMRGEIEVTLRRPREGAEYEESLRALHHDVLRMQTLGEHLLTSAKAREQDIALRHVNTSSLLRELVEELKPQLQQARIEVVLPEDDSIMILADPMYARRVWTNLFQNTLKHAEASRIEVSIVRSPKAAHLDFYIEDDGKGIEASLMPHLFAPFQRANQNSYGLGLYMTQQLMEAQGGTIELCEHEHGVRWRLRFGLPTP